MTIRTPSAILCVVLLVPTLIVGTVPTARAASTGTLPPCTCTKTGPYVSPAVATAGAVDPALKPGGTSPHGTYTVSSSVAGTQRNLTVTRTSNGSTVQTFTIRDSQPGWGFSPDDDRFVMWDVVDGMENVTLWDLAAGTQRASTSISPSSLSFSPKGGYLQIRTPHGVQVSASAIDVHTGTTKSVISAAATSAFGPDDGSYLVTNPDGSASLYRLSDGARVFQSGAGPLSAYGFSPTGNMLEVRTVTDTTQLAVTIVDIGTGATVYQSNGLLYTPPGTPGAKNMGSEGAGFGPDGTTFVEATLNSSHSATWTVVDLASGTQTTVPLSGSAYWLFSPCGEVAALISQTSQTNQHLTLVRAADGSSLASTDLSLADLTLHTTADSHMLTMGGSDQVLAANGCHAPPPQTTEAPGAPTAVAAQPYVRGAHLTWHAPTTGDPVTHATVHAFRDGVSAGTIAVPDGATSAEFATTDDGSYTFTVVASNDGGDSPASAASPAITIVTGPACGSHVWTPGPTSGSASGSGTDPHASYAFTRAGVGATFTDTSTVLQSAQRTWSWGDGTTTTGTGGTATHAYAYWGDYQVSLTITMGSATSIATSIVHIAPAGVPGNDDLADATALTLTTAGGTISGSTGGAGCETDEPVSGRQGTVWYHLTAASAATLKLDARTEHVTIHVWSGSAVDDLNPIGVALQEPLASTYALVPLTAGQSVWVQVTTPIGTSVDYSIPWSFILPPANDHRANASTLDLSSRGSVTGTTDGATPDADEPPSDPGDTPRVVVGSVWHTFTPTRDGYVTFDIGDPATPVRYFQKSSDGSLVELNNDYHFVHLFKAGTTYFAEVYAAQFKFTRPGGSWWTDPMGLGPYSLTWHVAPANDLVKDAVAISGEAGSTSGTTQWAYFDDLEDIPANLSDAESTVWYAWTAPSDGPVSFAAGSTQIERPVAVVFDRDPSTQAPGRWPRPTTWARPSTSRTRSPSMRSAVGPTG